MTLPTTLCGSVVHHSIFTFAALMTSPHFAESLRRYSAKASSGPGTGCTAKRSSAGELNTDATRYGSYDIGIEQEPGSGGKESVERTISNLAGYSVYADKVTGSKEVRAEPFAAQVQGGNVYLVAGDWHYAYLDELESFPAGKWKDQVDASAGAFMRFPEDLGPAVTG
jgi:predicted phage terminase large subunit-like protein